jgi:hypothetical protein
VHSFLGVPIASRERTHGWLYLVDKLGADGFSEVDERVAGTVAAQVAVAFENLLLYEEIKRHHAQLTLDMNARIRLDEDLRRFRLAMDATADAISWSTAPACALSTSTPRLAACWASSAKTFRGGPNRSLEGELHKLEELYDKLLAGDQSGAMTELQLQCQNGALAVEVQRRTLRSGSSWILVAVARDHRAQGSRAAPAQAGPLRHPDRAAQPQPVLRFADPLAAPGGRTSGRWRCCSSMSTASRTSTTRWATPSATSCCASSPAGWSIACACATPSAASAATSLPPS